MTPIYLIKNKNINFCRESEKRKRKEQRTIDAENAFDKSTSFHDKTSQQTRSRREISHLIEGIYKNPTAKIILNG